MDEPKAEFIVGQPVEIKTWERVWLQAHTHQMVHALEDRKEGWFLRYLLAHNSAHRIIREIFKRAHAS